MNWKGCRRKWLLHNLRSYSNICLKELRKMKILSQDRWDVNLGAPTRSRNTTWPWCYVTSTENCIGLILHNSTMHNSCNILYQKHKHHKDVRWFYLRKIQFKITTGSNSTNVYRIYSNRKWPPPPPRKSQMLRKIPTQNALKFNVGL
jgi:hypothetical protein